MNLLVVSPETGAGSQLAIDGVSKLATTTIASPSIPHYYSQHVVHEVTLVFGTELYYMLPHTKPTAWYCLEPPPFRLYNKRREKVLGPIEKWRVGKLDACIVADKLNAIRFEKTYGIFPNIVPYGIDYEFWSKTPAPIEDEIFTIAHIGEIQQFKNQMRSVEAFAELKERVPNARLWIIGVVRDQKYFKSLYTRAEDLGVKFTYIHQVSREHLRDEYFSYIDCVFHPIKLQGGFLTPLEAACANRPVIVSQDSSCSDIIYNHYLGVVSSERNYSYWLELIGKFGFAPRSEWIRDNLTWEKYCDGIKRVLEETV